MGTSKMHNLYIIWEDVYNIGIPIIDEQHRAIVSTINTYHYFVTNGAAIEALKPTFVTLDQYTKTHFMTEESLLKKTEYPELQSHQKLHAELLISMNRIAKEAVNDKDYDIVLSFLRKWWLTHIRIEDTRYVSYLKEKLE